MTAVAFIGLGIMGAPMAENLVRAGFDVIGFSRSAEPRERLAAAGGRAAASAREAATDADVVITMLPDGPDVESVLFGDGVIEAARPGTLLLDMSTISPLTARAIASRAGAAGLRMLDAPVSGGQQGAVDAALSIMVGGDEADFADALPVLSALGSTVVRVGPIGSGQQVKAANQLIVAGTIELVAEALTLLDAEAVDLTEAVRVLAGGLAGNRILDRKASGMIAHRFDPGFRVDLHHKDLGIVMESARAAGVILPVGSLVAQLMGSLRARGHGGLDHTALLLGVEALSGRDGRA